VRTLERRLRSRRRTAALIGALAVVAVLTWTVERHVGDQGALVDVAAVKVAIPALLDRQYAADFEHLEVANLERTLADKSVWPA